MPPGWYGCGKAQGGGGQWGRAGGCIWWRHNALCLLGGSNVRRRGRLIPFAMMAASSPSPATLAGIAAGSKAATGVVAAQQWHRQRGGTFQQRPLPRRGTTAMANAVAFFTRMSAFICWQGGGCGNNGGVDVLAPAAASAGSGHLKESMRGE
jgi:hypothetical protein